MVFLYSPTPSKSSAESIARALLKKNLIACANILKSSTSLYRWKGKDVKPKEWILLCKTTKAKATRAARTIEALHLYECPCVLQIASQANAQFEEWVKTASA